jgi:hypothetical protein
MVVGGIQFESMLCYCKIWCRAMPSTKPPKPTPSSIPAVVAFLGWPVSAYTLLTLCFRFPCPWNLWGKRRRYPRQRCPLTHSLTYPSPRQRLGSPQGRVHKRGSSPSERLQGLGRFSLSRPQRACSTAPAPRYCQGGAGVFVQIYAHTRCVTLVAVP